MAAKKKSDSSEENKKKATPKTSPKKTNTPRKKPVAKKKPAVKKKAPVAKPKKKSVPTPKAVLDEDFGLEEVELTPIEETPAPKPAVKEKPKSNFVPASQRPQEVKSSKNGITITIVSLLAIAALYFLVLKPKTEEPEPEPVKIVQPKPVEEPDPEPEPVIEEAQEPLAVTTISEREGRFYVVVGSFYDADFAEDKANDLIEAGIQSFILQPQEGQYYYRVGIMQSGNFAEANSGINEQLKQTFGDEIWVLKY